MSKQYYKDGYIFVPGVRKNKKYSVYNGQTGKYITSFGDTRYEHYYDKIGHYEKQNHKNIRRRRLYYDRHGKNAQKDTAKYFSHHYLW